LAFVVRFFFVLLLLLLLVETPASTGVPPVPRGGHTCSLFGDRFLVFLGGGDGVVVHNECFCYDTLSDEWLTLQVLFVVVGTGFCFNEENLAGSFFCDASSALGACSDADC
jgi:hypothetical protein